jgi:MraZ protein
MRKTHCACLLFGLLLGMPLGVGLVVMHMKYGQGPIVAVDTSPEALQETVLEEPKADGAPFGDDGWATADPGQSDDGCQLGLEPVGPVQVTVVQHTPPRAGCDDHGPLAQAPSEDEASRREGCERRMLQHLLRHAQTAVQQPCQSETGEESPAAEPSAELAQPETPEPLPMPTAEPEAAVIRPPDERWSAPLAYPKQKLHVPSEAPPQQASPTEDFNKAIRGLATPGRMPCTGAYQAALREDRKLQLPAEVCDMLVGGLPQTLYLVPLEQRVRLYTPRGLKNMLQALQASGFWGKTEPHEQAVLMSCIRRVEVSEDGKLKVPAELAKFGGLNNRVILVGVNDHVELWDAEAWREAVTAVLPDAEGLALPADEDGEAVTEVQDN